MALMPTEAGLTSSRLRSPAMPGAEYASPEIFAGLWGELAALARGEARAAGGLRAWLGEINPALHLLGRVTFHLAENKRSPETPFKLYGHLHTPALGPGKPVHLPLGRALQEYVGAKKPGRAAAARCSSRCARAAEGSAWTRELLDSRRVFQAQAWTPPQAYAFLREVPVLETSGIITRIPNWVETRTRAATAGECMHRRMTQGAGRGAASMLQFSVDGDTRRRGADGGRMAG